MDPSLSHFPSGTRQFHIDFEGRNHRHLSVDVSIEAKTLQDLSEDESLQEVQVGSPAPEGTTETPRTYKKTQGQKEYDVIRSIVEKAYSEKSVESTGNMTLVVSDSGINVNIGGEVKLVKVDVSATPHQSSSTGTFSPTQENIRSIRVVETTQQKSMIEKTMIGKSNIKPRFTGKTAALKKALHPIFTALGAKFESIDKWWKKIVGMSMEMPWNMNVLGHSVGIDRANNDNVSLGDALQYISIVTSSFDPNLSESLRTASSLDKDLAKANKSLVEDTAYINRTKAAKFEEEGPAKVIEFDQMLRSLDSVEGKIEGEEVSPIDTEHSDDDSIVGVDEEQAQTVESGKQETIPEEKKDKLGELKSFLTEIRGKIDNNEQISAEDWGKLAVLLKDNKSAIIAAKTKAALAEIEIPEVPPSEGEVEGKAKPPSLQAEMMKKGMELAVKRQVSNEVGKHITELLDCAKFISDPKRKAEESFLKQKQESLLEPLKKQITNSVDQLAANSKDCVFIPLTKSSNGEETLLRITRRHDGKFTLGVFTSGAPGKVYTGLDREFLDGTIEMALKATTDPEYSQKLNEKLSSVPSDKQRIVESKDLGRKNAVSTVASVASGLFSGKEGEYVDLALRVRLFIDMCNATPKWLQDPEYHRNVQKKCYAILDESNEFFKGAGISDAQVQVELMALRSEVEKILAKTEAVLPKIPDVNKVKLDVLGGSEFPNFPSNLPPVIDEVVVKPLISNDIVAKMVKVPRGQELSDNLSTLRQNVSNIKNNKTENLFDMSAGIVKEMGKKLTFAPCNRNSPEDSNKLTDADIVNPYYSSQVLPNLSGSSLTRDEFLALGYTLHSQEDQSNDIEYRFGKDNKPAENLARAHYTFQALLDHPRLGRSPEIQGWITTQLFDEGRVKLLLSMPDGREALNSYLQTLRRKGSELMDIRPESSQFTKDYTSGLFLLSIVNRIELEAKSTLSDDDYQMLIEGVDPPLRDLPAIINLQASKSSVSAKSIQNELFPAYLGMICDNLAYSSQEIDTQQLVTILTALSRNVSGENPALQKKIEQIKPYIFVLAAKKIKDGENEFVTNYATILGNGKLVEGVKKWEFAKPPSGFPILEGTNNNGQLVQLNLVSGEVFTGGERAARLPKEVADDPNVMRLFANPGQRLWRVQEPKAEDLSNPEAEVTIYASADTDSSGANIPLRIVVTKTKVEGGSTYTSYIERQDELPFGKKEWAVYHYFEAQEALKRGRASLSNDLPISVASAIGDRSCWLSRNNPRIHIYDIGTNSHYATYETTVGISGEKTKLKLSDKRSLLEPTPKALKRLSSIEDPYLLTVYGENGKTSKVEYPRLKMAATGEILSYEISQNMYGTTKITSSKFPGWELAPVGKAPGYLRKDPMGASLPPALPAGFTSFQLLEKGEKQKVLIAGRELKLIDGSSKAKGTYDTKPVPGKDFKSSKVFEYSINAETNRLESSSAEANLQLAYISFVHKDYTGALFYAEKARTGTGDVEGFQEIFECVQRWDDPSPSGVAVKLKLLCMAERFQERAILTEKQQHKSSAPLESKLTVVDYSKDLKSLHSKYLHVKVPKALELSNDERELLGEKLTGPNSKVVGNITKIKAELNTGDAVSGKQEKVTTDKDRIVEVVGRGFFEKIKNYFELKPTEKPDINLGFFDDLKSPPEDPAVARVAATHKKDTEVAIAQQSKETASISRDKANALKKDFMDKAVDVAANKERYMKLALNALEGTSRAGTVAVERDLGLDERATINTLMQIWRSGNLRDASDDNPINKLAQRKLGKEELADLDWYITQYMASSVDLNHINSVVKAADAYIDSCSGLLARGDNNLAQDLYTLAATKRGYAMHTPWSEFSVQDFAEMAKKDPKGFKDVVLPRFKNLASLPQDLRSLIGQISDAKPELIDQIVKHPQFHNLAEALKGDEGALRLICDRLSDPDSRDLLSIEYSTGFVLRENQIETLRDMLSNPNAVRQLGMGGGKSKVLLPLLAKRKCTGHNVVALLLPEALYETNRRDLDKTNRELFGQDYFCFEYNKNSDLGVNDLNKLHEQLLNAAKNKGFIALRKSDLQSFRNAFTSKVKALQEGKVTADKRAEALAEIKAMADILTTFKERLDIIADEVDSVLDVRKELNFAEGNPLLVDPVKTGIGFEFMEIIFDAKEGEPLYVLQQALINNTQALIPPDKRNELMQKVADKYWVKHNKRPENDLGDKQTFINYVTASETVTKLPPFMQNLGVESTKYQEIAALKAFMKRGFGATLGKTCKVDYGRDPDAEKPFTIPYKASNTPSVGSEFDDDVERIAFTLQDYCSQKVDRSVVYRCVANLALLMDSQYKEGKRTDPTFKKENTEAYKTFAALVEKMDPPSGPNGTTIISRDLRHAAEDEEAVAKLTDAINQTPRARMAFCKTYTLDTQMKLYPEQVTSNAEDLVDMVHSFGGFTGTPWNLHTFHDRIDAERNMGVDGRTYALLLAQNSPVQTIAYNPKDPSASLINTDPKYNIIVDTGALLRGIENGDFMKQLMGTRKASGNEVGIYFDESGRMVGRKPDGQIIPMDQIPAENLKDRMVLFDQSHTVGADVKLDRKAVAAVTIGKDTSTRDLFQAVWRLRQLHLEQRVAFVVTAEMKSLILGGGPDRELTVEDVLAYCLKQEAIREAEDNYRAEGSKIRGTGSREMFDQLVAFATTLDTKPDKVEESIGQLNTLSKLYLPSLIKKRAGTESYEGDAAVSNTQDPVTALATQKENEAKRLAAIAEAVKQEPGFESQGNALESKATELGARNDKNPDLMPRQVDVTATVGGNEVQAEVQMQVAVNIQLQQQVEQQTQVENVVEPTIPDAKEAGGSTQMIGSSVLHNDLTNLSANQIEKNKFCTLHDHVGCFDKRIAIGRMYEGRLKSDPISTDAAKKFGRIGSDRDATERASAVLHSQRLPINEALFIYNPKSGWNVVFGSTHDAYPSFSSYPSTTSQSAALVMIGSSGPFVTIRKNGSFENTLQDPKQRKEFYNLYVQLKFLRGAVEYNSKEEVEALEAWIKGGGNPKVQLQRVKDMRHLYEQNIRATKSAADQQDLGYSRSQLKGIFDKLEKELSPSLQVI